MDKNNNILDDIDKNKTHNNIQRLDSNNSKKD